MAEHPHRAAHRRFAAVLHALLTLPAPITRPIVIVVQVAGNAPDTDTDTEQATDPAAPTARARGPPPTPGTRCGHAAAPCPPPTREENRTTRLAPARNDHRRVTARHAENNRKR